MKILNKIFVFVCFFSLFSCSWLDLDPEGEATDEKLFKTGDGYRSVLGGVYKAMTAKTLYGVELQFGLVDCISQQYEWNWNQYNQGKNIYQYAKEYEYTNTDLRSSIDDIWSKGYNVIANANKLIQNISNASDDIFAKGEMERKMIMGEAYACRALMHFDLCRLFAPAPIENENGSYLPYVDTYPNIQPNSIPTNEFLGKVIEDLKTAEQLTMAFDTTSLGQSVNASVNARFDSQLEYGTTGYQKEKTLDDFFLGRGYRLNLYAVKALLARVYNYVGDYENAYKYAEEVINAEAHRIDEGTYQMFKYENFNFWGNYDDLTDLKVKSTLVFALYNDEAYTDYNLESYFRKKVSDNNVGNWFSIDTDNQNIFKRVSDGVDESEEDVRSQKMLYKVDYWSSVLISGKWYCSDNEAIRKKNTQILPIIRTSELRYIMAEYKARQGLFGEAYEILNQMRANRSLYDGLTEKSNLNDFLADMTNDAQREYISEGQLFYLYKRLQSKIKINESTRAMSKSEYMFPIPINQNM